MNTVSEVLNKLKKEGYTVDFNLKENCLVCHDNTMEIYPEEFVVDKHYRFEGTTDPGDEAVVYAISSSKHNIKGTLVNAYGIYSDKIVDEMVKVLNLNMFSDSTKNTITKEKRFNEATSQRPEGDRLLDAQMITMNLSSSREQLKHEQTWKNSDRNSITLFKTNGMRVVLIALHKGAEMKTHTAPGIITVQVLEGEIKFHTDNQSEALREGQMLALHAGIPHSVFAKEESVFLLTMATA